MNLFDIIICLPWRWHVHVGLSTKALSRPAFGVLLDKSYWDTGISLYLGWVGLDVIIERGLTNGGL